MSLADPLIFVTENQDGSADFTISVDDEDHKFSVSPDGYAAILAYEETMTYRGVIRVSEPDDHVWEMLMKSDKMTAYLESEGLTSVRRQR